MNGEGEEWRDRNERRHVERHEGDATHGEREKRGEQETGGMR